MNWICISKKVYIFGDQEPVNGATTENTSRKNLVMLQRQFFYKHVQMHIHQNLGKIWISIYFMIHFFFMIFNRVWTKTFSGPCRELPPLLTLHRSPIFHLIRAHIKLNLNKLKYQLYQQWINIDLSLNAGQIVAGNVFRVLIKWWGGISWSQETTFQTISSFFTEWDTYIISRHSANIG